MTWRDWDYGTDVGSAEELSGMIEGLMREVAFELKDPGLDEWFEAGINLTGGPDGDEEIIVYS